MFETNRQAVEQSANSSPLWLDADDWSALGKSPAFIQDARLAPPAHCQSVMIGVDLTGSLECRHQANYDVLITTVQNAPAPWISVPENRAQDEAEALTQRVRQFPMAATILCRLLRLTENMAFDDALFAESLAFSTLLGGAEFRKWLENHGDEDVAGPSPEPVLMARQDDLVTISLISPHDRNAMTARMRDALFEALCAVIDDPSQPHLLLKAEGRCFSVGGALNEFGRADDLAKAHVIRTLRNGARILHALDDRAAVHIQGAAIGSGLELAAAASHRTASVNAWFQLPELTMGLIPGAGGTVTLPRAIGRHRAAWLALSGRKINTQLALSLGLIHAISET